MFTNTSGSGTGTGGVTVGTATSGTTATLAGNGIIKPGSGAASGVSITSGGNPVSGGVASGTPTVGPGTGITLNNTVAQLGTNNVAHPNSSILSVGGDDPADTDLRLRQRHLRPRQRQC